MQPVTSAGQFKLVVIGASAGGLHDLVELLTRLPAAFPLPIVIVLHLDPRHTSVLASILDRQSTIRVKSAESGETPRAGTVYVAPPDRHLMIDADGRFALNTAPPVHFVRPSVDRLFSSAAENLGRVIAVVLSGMGNDGAAGSRSINAHSGVVVVEDAATAAFGGMPQAAIDSGAATYVMQLEQIPSLLVKLADEVAEE